MKLIVIHSLIILVTLLTVNCGMQLNFGVNLPPFVLRLPRFKLPPVRMSVTFNHSPDSQPLKIHFPGISISNTNQHHDSWSDNSVVPEPESEPEHNMYHDPEAEPEPGTYSHQQINYHQNNHHQQGPIINHGYNYNHNDFYGDKSLAKSTSSTGIGSYHLQQRSRRESMTINGNDKPIQQRQSKIVIKSITNNNQCVNANCSPRHNQLLSQYNHHLGSQSSSIMVTEPTITNNLNNLRLTLIAPTKSTSPLPSNWKQSSK